MKLEEIIKAWLKENGYDGLCNTDIECGCAVEDFMPCGEPSIYCEAGHQEPAPEGSGVDYFIYTGKARLKVSFFKFFLNPPNEILRNIFKRVQKEKDNPSAHYSRIHHRHSRR